MERYELLAVMEMIAKGYKFDGETYPELAGKDLDGTAVLNFGIRHSLHHIQKGVGRIAEYVEKSEHGGPFGPGDVQFLDETVKKQFVNVLRLAELLNISADDLMGFAVEKYASR